MNYGVNEFGDHRLARKGRRLGFVKGLKEQDLELSAFGRDHCFISGGEGAGRMQVSAEDRKLVHSLFSEGRRKLLMKMR